MKQPHISRRQFFKLSAFGAGTVAASSLVSIATAPSGEAQASTVEPHKLAIPQPTFNPIASTTAFGPLTDLSAGWDGTLWSIDASGAPHLYDPTTDSWLPFGDGVDAVTAIGNLLYVFRGPYYVTVNLTTNQTSAPSLIATTWPSLRDSFKLRVTGAASANGKLVLFNGGWYAYADGSAPPKKLTSLALWPTTPTWADGLVDAVIYSGIYLDRDTTFLVRGSEALAFVIESEFVFSVDIKSVLPAAWASTGVDAGTLTNDGTIFYFYKGVQVIKGSASPQYIAAAHQTWPAAWNPQLQHAPSGRMGNLWTCLQSSGAPQNMPILQHDGDQWNVKPGLAYSASAGQDGEVFVASTAGLFRWHESINNYDFWGAPFAMNQVAVGDAKHVWVRDSNNTVHQFTASNTSTATNLGVGIPAPTHMAANADGTLWHCNSSNANAYRFLSDANSPQAGIPIKQGIVSAVQKVAATGFGAAYCLAQQNGQTQVYRYDSPYVFKTPSAYSAFTRGPLAQGLGMLYITAVQSYSTSKGGAERTFLVAIDAHTGAELSRSAVRDSEQETTHGLPTFDSVNNLIYVGTHDYFDQGSVAAAGLMLALDARDLTKVVWSFNTPASIDAKPVVAGTMLTFGDRTGTLYRFDTTAALAQKSNPQPTWTWKPAIGAATTYRVVPPLLDDGKLVTVFWDFDGNNRPAQAWMGICNASDGSEATIVSIYTPQNPGSINIDTLLTEPVQGKVIYGNAPGVVAPGYYCNGGDGIFVAGSGETGTFYLPAGTSVTTGVNYDADTQTAWFGAGPVLYALNKNLSPVSYTPFTFDGGPGRLIYSRPVIYTDPKGEKTILTGLYDESATSGSLYGFDPANGNVASIQTGVTLISALSEGVTNGVVYASGTIASLGSANGFSQVFGIRVDALPQAQRDFVIESQMMQDPDQNGSGNITPNQPLPPNPIPPSVARYQTHLTVVDDQKTPLARESVKIWCDTPNTKITVDGQPFTVGPDDASFAAVKTGVDGSLVIMMDATDYFAPTLRVWASFMDPYERIVVNADAEFHQRVMTAHANASDDDPNTVNLMTATNYKGASLFTADEKNQNPSQPQNIASAIQQANTGLGLKNGNSKGLYRKMMRAMGVKHKNQRISVQWLDSNSPPSREGLGVGATPDKYMAYADLPGATHFPTNIPSSRLASIVQPIGLSFSRPNGDCTKVPAFAAIAHADARAAIDALEGTPWQPNDSHSSHPGQCVPPQADASSPPSREGAGVGAPMRAMNIFQDFWNWLKGLIDKITQCILSIGEDILAGIQYIVNGILKVFKAIIKVLDDVFPFLGSFFKMLEKLIDDVVAALSLLFHFGEIIQTHKWLRDQINANLQQAIGAMQTQVKPDLDAFFNQGEQAIQNLFSSIRQQLGINDDTQINSVNSARSTPHTAFAAGPGVVGANSGSSSHAVQCTHTAQKMKNGLPSATAQSDTPISGNDDAALSGFLTNFVDSLQNNPTIRTAFAALQSAINNISHPQSGGDFFKAALNLLLTIVEDLIVGMVAVTQALADGLIGVIQSLVNVVIGLLNTPIDIPFLGWLYQLIFDEPLTILNAVSLVAAIPVTIIYRVVEGHYPSQDGITGTVITGLDAARPGRATEITVDVLKKMQGLIGGTIALGLGIARGVVDEAGAEPPRIGTIFVLTFGVAYAATYFPLMIPGPPPSGLAWAAWGLGLCLALLGTFGVIDLKSASKLTQVIFKAVLTVLRVGLGAARFIVFIVAFAQSGNRNAVSDVQFARSLFLELPPMFNWLKLLPEPANIVLTVIDAVTGVVVCALDITAAFLNTARAPRRYYFPFVPYTPVPVKAHP
jgi:hypothetical protein